MGARIAALGNRVTSLLDAVGRQIATVDARGNRESVLCDAASRVVAQQDARGYIVTMILDALGHRIGVVDANGGRVTALFATRGAEVASMDQLGALTSWILDEDGNDILRLDACQWPTSDGYDALDREVTRQYLDGTRVSHSFDADGRLLVIADATGLISRQYDLLNRETEVAYPSGHWLTCESVNGTVNDGAWMTAFGVGQHAEGVTIWPYLFGGAVGYQRDVESEAYVGARWYEAAAGRWASEVPDFVVCRPNELARPVPSPILPGNCHSKGPSKEDCGKLYEVPVRQRFVDLCECGVNPPGIDHSGEAARVSGTLRGCLDRAQRVGCC